MSTDTALLVATALHAGFQLTVTLVVYPALAATAAEAWTTTHRAHTRRITPLVAVVYAVALGAMGWALARSPAAAAVWVSAAATVLAVLLTATLAGPTHGRLGEARTPDLLARLLLVDRLRCGCALVALAAAVVAG